MFKAALSLFCRWCHLLFDLFFLCLFLLNRCLCLSDKWNEWRWYGRHQDPTVPALGITPSTLRWPRHYPAPTVQPQEDHHYQKQIEKRLLVMRWFVGGAATFTFIYFIYRNIIWTSIISIFLVALLSAATAAVSLLFLSFPPSSLYRGILFPSLFSAAVSQGAIPLPVIPSQEREDDIPGRLFFSFINFFLCTVLVRVSKPYCVYNTPCKYKALTFFPQQKEIKTTGGNEKVVRNPAKIRHQPHYFDWYMGFLADRPCILLKEYVCDRVYTLGS